MGNATRARPCSHSAAHLLCVCVCHRRPSRCIITFAQRVLACSLNFNDLDVAEDNFVFCCLENWQKGPCAQFITHLHSTQMSADFSLLALMRWILPRCNMFAFLVYFLYAQSSLHLWVVNLLCFLLRFWLRNSRYLCRAKMNIFDLQMHYSMEWIQPENKADDMRKERSITWTGTGLIRGI